MQPAQPIDCFVINSGKFMAFTLPYILVAPMIDLFIAIELKAIYVGQTIFVIMILCLFIFEKKIRGLFSKKAQVTVGDDGLQVKLYNIKTVEGEGDNQYYYTDIAAFTTAEGYRNDFTSCKLFMRDGSKVGYQFYGQKTDYKHEVNRLLFQRIKAYNTAHPQGKIIIHPSYFTTHSGKVLSLVLGLFFAAVITTVAFIQPQAIPPTLILPSLFFLGIVLGSISRYKRQKKELGES